MYRIELKTALYSKYSYRNSVEIRFGFICFKCEKFYSTFRIASGCATIFQNVVHLISLKTTNSIQVLRSQKKKHEIHLKLFDICTVR